jgi:hypothetical protein
MLVKLKPRKPTSGSYQLPSAKQLSASEAALTAYFRALP